MHRHYVSAGACFGAARMHCLTLSTVFTLAPPSMRAATMSASPFKQACDMAVQPRFCERVVMVVLVVVSLGRVCCCAGGWVARTVSALTLAPALMRSLATSTCPADAASSSGVHLSPCHESYRVV